MSFRPNFTVFKSKFFWTFQVFVLGNRCSTSPIKQPQVTYIYTFILFSLVSTPLPIHLLHPPAFNTIMFSDCFLPYWFLWDSNLTGENCHKPSHTHALYRATKPSPKQTRHHDTLFPHTCLLLSHYLVIPCSLVSIHLYCTHCSFLVTLYIFPRYLGSWSCTHYLILDITNVSLTLFLCFSSLVTISWLSPALSYSPA